MKPRRRSGIVSTLALTASICAAPPSSAGEAASMGIQETIRSRIVRLPVLVDEKVAGGCDGIQASEIRLTEDGVPVRNLQFEPTPLVSLHAFLIDNGVEMLESIRELRASVGASLRRLPAEELAMIATADEDVTLLSPPTPDRLPALEALEWLDVARDGPFWRSTEQLLRYLASRPERQLLVVITDGCDTVGPAAGDPQAVLEVAERMENLSVFPIVLRGGRNCRRGDRDSVAELEELVQRTRGMMQYRENPRDLAEALSAVVQRVAREKTATYAPVELGQAPGDDDKSFRWRRRKIGFNGKRACTISIAGPPLRYEGTTRDPGPALSAPVGAVIRPFELDRELERAEGVVSDRLVEAQVRSTGGPLGLVPGVGRPPLDLTPIRTAQRTVRLLTRPVELTRRTTTPAQALEIALAEAVPGDVAGWWEVPTLVHGSSFLDLRPALAEVLAGRRDYADWARDRVRPLRLREFETLVATSAEPIEPQALERARRALEGVAWEPEADERQALTTAWLGDVPISGLSNELERRLGRRVFAAANESPDALERAVRTAGSDWRRFRQWFPRPHRVHVVALMVPAYDPSLDAFGFFRILLRQPVSAEIGSRFAAAGNVDLRSFRSDPEALDSRLRTANFAAGEPLGVRLASWLATRPEIAPYLGDRFELLGVRYAHAGARDLQRVFEITGNDEPLDAHGEYFARQVTLVLDPWDSPDPLQVTAYFAMNVDGTLQPSDGPACILFPAQPPLEGASFGLLGALLDSHRRGLVPCLLREGAS